MRKISVLLITFFLVIFPLQAMASGTAVFRIGVGKYIVNNLVRNDVAPYIENGRTYLPLRYVAYAVGVGDNNIAWDGDSRIAYLASPTALVEVKVGESAIWVNSNKVQTDAPAELINGRVMLPLRAVSEAFGCQLQWDQKSQSITVTVP